MHISSNLVPTSQSQVQRGDAYLQFQFNQHILAALDIKYIQEVVSIPIDSIAPMPNMAKSIVGLINWRNRIVWTVDLSILFNFKEQNNSTPQQYNVIIIRVKSKILGLIVPYINGTISLIHDAIKSPENRLEADLVQYLRGCAYRDDEKILILDAAGISESADLWSDRNLTA